MRHEAIRNIHPTVFSILNDFDAADAQGQPVVLNEAKIAIEIVRLQATQAAIQYRLDRATAYPHMGDQLDALWKGGDAADEMRLKVQAVKAKYPKHTK